MNLVFEWVNTQIKFEFTYSTYKTLAFSTSDHSLNYPACDSKAVDFPEEIPFLENVYDHSGKLVHLSNTEMFTFFYGQFKCFS